MKTPLQKRSGEYSIAAQEQLDGSGGRRRRNLEKKLVPQTTRALHILRAQNCVGGSPLSMPWCPSTSTALTPRLVQAIATC